jgi:hypothetical protein
VAVIGVVRGDEVVKVTALERIFLQGEVFVGTQIANPEL